MARAEQSLFVFLKIHEAPQMRADPGKSDIPFIRSVDDDAGNIIKDDILRVSDGDFVFTENEFLCHGLFGRRREIFDQGEKEGGEGRQSQEGKRFL